MTTHAFDTVHIVETQRTREGYGWRCSCTKGTTRPEWDQATVSRVAHAHCAFPDISPADVGTLVAAYDRTHTLPTVTGRDVVEWLGPLRYQF